VRILTGIEVIDYDIQGGRVTGVVTNQGTVKCDLVVWGLGAWTPKHWALLHQPMTLDCHYADGNIVKDKDMWT
jgi:glycine/D-amino acid oxidase-like deaminating enzyme